MTARAPTAWVRKRVRTAAMALMAAAGAGLYAAPVSATDDIQTAWAAWFGSFNLDQRNTLIADVQVRSRDDLSGVRTALVRAGLARPWRPGISLGIGAAYIQTVNSAAPDVKEYRLWQQAVVQTSLGPRSLTQRVRLEQRFIDEALGDDLYSTRLRYLVRFTVPLHQADGSTGYRYLALQNEAMLNLTGQDELNKQLFDQNRAYIGLGRRLHPGLDLELGYLNQYVVGLARDTRNHVIQASVHTRW